MPTLHVNEAFPPPRYGNTTEVVFFLTNVLELVQSRILLHGRDLAMNYTVSTSSPVYLNILGSRIGLLRLFSKLEKLANFLLINSLGTILTSIKTICSKSLRINLLEQAV